MSNEPDNTTWCHRLCAGCKYADRWTNVPNRHFCECPSEICGDGMNRYKTSESPACCFYEEPDFNTHP